MRLVEIAIRNFRSIGELTFRFDEGVFALVGDNGAGKSSLLMAVDVALYGRRSLAGLIRWGQDDLSLQLTFEHAGETWRVRRSLKRGGNTKLDLEVMVDGTWEPRTLATAADTQAYLVNLIGVTSAVFRAYAYFAQRKSDSFAGALPSERKQSFGEALNLGGLAVGAKAAGADRLAVEKQLTAVAGKVDGLAERAAQTETLATEAGDLRLTVDVAAASEAEARTAAEAHAAREADLDEAERQWEIRTAAVTAARAVNGAHLEKLTAAQVARERLDGDRQDLIRLVRLDEERSELTAKRAALAEQDAACAEATRVSDGHLAEVARLSDALARATTITATNAAEYGRLTAALNALVERTVNHCDRCAQTLPDEAREAASASLGREIDELDLIHTRHLADVGRDEQRKADAIAAAEAVEIPDAPEGIADIDARLTELATVPMVLATVRERIAGLEATVAATDTDEYRDTARRLSFELAEAENALAQIVQPEPGEADAARDAGGQAKEQAEAHAARARTASERLAAVGALLEQAQAALVEHAAAISERDRLHHEIDVLAWVEQALGRDGLPAWIVEKEIPEFEAVTNDYLRRLGSVPSRIELRNERETKDGKKSEALDIICHSDEGSAAIEDFSGGEEYRSHLALAFGMRHVVANNGGADIRYLALDEPEGLDAQGKEALAEILREIVTNGVDTALLASHDPGLRDQFDQSVLVERGPGGSKVVA